MAIFLSFQDIVSLTSTVFPSQRDFGPPVTFDCKPCQTCQEAWVDHAQIILISGKGSISNSHTTMNQFLTKLLLVKPNNTLVIRYIIWLYFQNTIVTLHIISVTIQERDMPFEVFQRYCFLLQMEQILFSISLHLFQDGFFSVSDKQVDRQGVKRKVCRSLISKISSKEFIDFTRFNLKKKKLSLL